MAAAVPFACRCGSLSGHLTAAGPAHGLHVICYCRDCRAAARHLGAADGLTPEGGVPIYQTRPDKIAIDKGAEHLACLRLSPKGLNRWYASCCNTPLATTMHSRRLPFAGMSAGLFADPSALGPVRAHVNTSGAPAGSGAPKKDRGMIGAAAGVLGRVAGAYLSGNVRRTPFFDADGAPVATPHVITLEERQKASL